MGPFVYVDGMCEVFRSYTNIFLLNGLLPHFTTLCTLLLSHKLSFQRTIPYFSFCFLFFIILKHVLGENYVTTVITLHCMAGAGNDC